MQERGELGVAAATADEAQLVADGEDQLEDVAAVRARVGVVGLDDVAEQHRRAAVGARELERLVHAPLPLARREADHEQQRQRQQEPDAALRGRERGQQAERREHEVDRERPGERGEQLERRMPSAARSRSAELDEVEGELAEERDGDDRQRARVERRRRAAREHEDERGPSAYQELPSRTSTRSGGCNAREVLGQLAEQRPRRRPEGDCAGRQQEQHLDQHELGRDGRAASDLELEP